MQTFLTVTLLGLAGSSMAFPSMALEYANKMGRSAFASEKRQLALGFDAAAQHIDVSGAHAFVPPGSGDQRGPCPGLNALANHNYISHDGITSFVQVTAAINQGSFSALAPKEHELTANTIVKFSAWVLT